MERVRDQTDVPAACRLKVILRHVQPPIWRRIEIATGATFKELHDVLQVVMGWTDSHLHAFEVGDQHIGFADADAPDEVAENTVFIRDVLEQGTRRLLYEYDFGDGREHEIEVEELFELAPGTVLPRCIGGKRSGPPEDVGGPYVYTENLAALGNRRHPRHREMADWFLATLIPKDSTSSRPTSASRVAPRNDQAIRMG
jgi:hypothetical protein